MLCLRSRRGLLAASAQGFATALSGAQAPAAGLPLTSADDQLLDDLSRRCFHYFWEQSDPHAGIARIAPALMAAGIRRKANMSAARVPPGSHALNLQRLATDAVGWTATARVIAVLRTARTAGRVQSWLPLFSLPRRSAAGVGRGSSTDDAGTLAFTAPPEHPRWVNGAGFATADLRYGVYF